jgi:hypothetical protein
MIRPFAQNIWDLRPPVSVELGRGQHGNALERSESLNRCLDVRCHCSSTQAVWKNTFGAALAGWQVWLKEHYPDAEQKDYWKVPYSDVKKQFEESQKQ